MIKQITPNVDLIHLPYNLSSIQANIYLIKDKNLLIDVGTGDYQTFCQLKSAINYLGKSIDELTIILTHHHPDHVGLLKYFPSKSKIYADPSLKYYGTLNYLKAIKSQSYIFQSLGIPSNVISKFNKHLKKRYLPFLSRFNFHDPRQLPINGLHFYSFKGHSSSDLVIQNNHTFFGGDLFLRGIYFNSLLDINPQTQEINSMASDYNQTTTWILNNLNIDQWLPGHGRLMNFNQLININQKYCQLYTRIHQQINQDFQFSDYSNSVAQIYRYFPKLNDYFYLSDLLADSDLLKN